MSRAFHPPDTLSKDNIRTIADVRREIWINSMKGLGVGSIIGLTTYAIASIGQHHFKLWKLSSKTLNRNTAFLSVLLGGALGSFIMSITTDRNNKLHEENEDETISTHLSLKELSILQQQQQKERQSLESINDGGPTIDRIQFEQNRLLRRATLTKKMAVPGNRFQDTTSSLSDDNIKVTSQQQQLTPPPHTVVEADGKLLSDQEIIQKSKTQQSR